MGQVPETDPWWTCYCNMKGLQNWILLKWNLRKSSQIEILDLIQCQQSRQKLIRDHIVRWRDYQNWLLLKWNLRKSSQIEILDLIQFQQSQQRLIRDHIPTWRDWKNWLLLKWNLKKKLSNWNFGSDSVSAESAEVNQGSYCKMKGLPKLNAFEVES